MPNLSTFVRHAVVGGRLRHPNRPGASGAQRREDHHDLHTRPQPGRQGTVKSPVDDF
jgi:hypothetical protein